MLVAVIIEAAVPATWHHLLVDPNTWHRVASSLRAPTERTLLAACVLVGLAGASDRVALGDRDRPGSIGHPALAVLPALILVTWSAAAAPGVVSGALCGGLIVLGGSLILFGDPVVQDSDADPDWSHAPWFSAERDHGCPSPAAGRISCGGLIGICQRCVGYWRGWVGPCAWCTDDRSVSHERRRVRGTRSQRRAVPGAQRGADILAGCGPDETDRWHMGSFAGPGSSTGRKGTHFVGW